MHRRIPKNKNLKTCGMWGAVLGLTRSPSSALSPFLGEGSPTKIDCRKKGTLILASLLEDLVVLGPAYAAMVWLFAYN